MPHPCSAGHTWKFVGGRNCGCHPDAQCSFPVHQCEVCQDYDYGDNPEANGIKSRCPDFAECKAKGPTFEPLHLTKAEFDALDEYSATLPTGTVAGKRWKRHDGVYDPACKKPVWLVGEYVALFGRDDCIMVKWYMPVPRLDAPLAGGAA